MTTKTKKKHYVKNMKGKYFVSRAPLHEMGTDKDETYFWVQDRFRATAFECHSDAWNVFVVCGPAATTSEE